MSHIAKTVTGVVLALSALTFIPKAVQGVTAQERLEKFQAAPLKKTWLWTECRKIPTWIIYGPTEHSRIPYPTEKSIDTIVHSRLRAISLDAKLGESTGVLLLIEILPIHSMYTASPNGVLSESLFYLLNELVFISFALNKYTDDPWTGEPRHTPVWSRERVVGVDRLREHVSELMDKFLEDYLLFNEPACQKR